MKHGGRTVHHRDGSTSTKFKVKDVDFFHGTYQEWMRRQLEEDPAFVRKVLGPARFELFKSGKLTLDKMVTAGKIKKLSDL